MTNKQNTVLRLITAGSVDDGKSTLIGRLLYDSHTLLSDQVEQLHQSQHKRTANGVPDFALLTDGLSAEREQGITIDVAYRYFNTSKRKFILADTPGHEQYTRNMVTGASTADAAIILIDASRLDLSQQPTQLLPQTLRHSVLLKRLACPHIVVAINKLDLLGYQQEHYQTIVAAYQQLAQQLDLHNVHYVPISALHGDNIVHRSENMPWYEGLSLLDLLSELPGQQVDQQSESPQHALFPVQRVARQDGNSADDFRGYQGRLEQGQLSVGQAVRVLPSQRTSKIKAIYGLRGQQDTATTGEVLTLTLEDEIDISRGNSIVALDHPVTSSKHIGASLCWFDETALNPSRKYWLKHGTQTVYAKVKDIHSLLNLKDLQEEPAKQQLVMNDIANVSLVLQQPIMANRYQDNKATGAFILIDDISYRTVAAGMIDQIEEVSA